MIQRRLGNPDQVHFAEVVCLGFDTDNEVTETYPLCTLITRAAKG